MYLTNLGEKWWVLGKGRGEKDVAGSKCPCFVALGGLSESQRSVLQARPIKYQFDPRLTVPNEPHSSRVKLVLDDTSDENVKPWKSILSKYSIQISF